MSRALSALLLLLIITYASIACSPCPPPGKWVVNADQTVIMVWDPAAKKQHFIRQASFASDADDFGFLVPSPSQPELAEAGNEAFQVLETITAPNVIVPSQGGGCSFGCGGAPAKSVAKSEAPAVRVLEEKLVAGFNAAVLEADNSEVLVKWLEEHGYSFSPAIAEWAEPYIEQKWKITALKVAKKDDAKAEEKVDASALRLTFDTDKPLFPYREPDYAKLAEGNEQHTKELAEKSRLLRIYFLSNARYDGTLTPEQAWTGKVAWAGELNDHQRKHLLEMLQLPEETGPAKFYLTEFEDSWPYKVAPGDVYFAEAAKQENVRRPDVYVSRESDGDILVACLVVLACVPLLWRRKWFGCGCNSSHV